MTDHLKNELALLIAKFRTKCSEKQIIEDELEKIMQSVMKIELEVHK